MWENMNVTNAARSGVVSSGKPSRTIKETACHRFSSSLQSRRLVVCAASLDIWLFVVLGENMHFSNVDQVVSKC